MLKVLASLAGLRSCGEALNLTRLDALKRGIAIFGFTPNVGVENIGVDKRRSPKRRSWTNVVVDKRRILGTNVGVDKHRSPKFFFNLNFFLIFNFFSIFNFFFNF